MRYAWWNRQPGFFVDGTALVNRSVTLEAEPHGICDGGKIYISARCRIADGVILQPGGGCIHLAENVFIGPYCVVYGTGGLRVGKNTMIAGHTFIVANNHVYQDASKLIWEQGFTKLGVTIGEDVWIGCGARIVDGVTISDGCVVGAGAVVTRSLPAYAIAVGVPAKIIGYRGQNSNSSTQSI